MKFPERHLFKQIIRYSLTALGANAVFFLVYRIDYLFVNYSPVCSAADLGNYIQVSKLGQMMLVVPQIIASVVFPRTASGIEPESLNKAIITIARIFSQLLNLKKIRNETGHGDETQRPTREQCGDMLCGALFMFEYLDMLAEAAATA